MIKAQQLAAELGRLLFRDAVIGRTDHEAPAGTFFGRVRQRHRRRHAIAGTDQRPTAFVRIGLFPMAADLAVDLRVHYQRLRGLRHCLHLGHQSFQNFSVRYFSAPSGQTVTMMPVLRPLATCNTAETAAPDEIPAITPSSRARRRTMSNASSLSTRRS